MENIMDNNSILKNLVMADKIMSRSGRKIILTWCLLSSIIVAQNTAYIEIAEADAYPGDNVQVEVSINAEGYTTGNGSFTGEYYNGIQGGSPEFGDLVLVREDFEINFDWGTGSPDSLVQNDYFQVRWTGAIYAHVSGTYYFRSYTDDGLRLFIDEQPVIDEWWDFAPTSHYGQIDLELGVHELEMEYYEMGGGAVAQLYWTPPGSAETIVQPSVVTNLNSAEFQFDGFQDFDVDFTGISFEGTQLGDFDWSIEYNNTDTMLYVAMTGADGINMADINTLFWLNFHVHDDAMLGDIPINFAGGILNTESPYWEVEPGGIWVMDPNMPPGSFSLLSPTDGETIVITGDNVTDSTAFAWQEPMDPEGDEISYLIFFDVFLDVPPPAYVFNTILFDFSDVSSFYLGHQDVVNTLSDFGAGTGNAWWSVIATDGMWFPTLDFFGNGDSYAEVPNDGSLNFGTGDFGVSLWFKFYPDFDTLGGSFTQQLLVKHDPGSNRYELQVNRFDNDYGVLTSYIGDDNFSSDMVLIADHLYHAVLTRDGDNVTMYINGEEVGQMASSGNTTSNESLFLGIDPYYGENFGGSMTDVAIWGGSISPEAVAGLYQDGNGMHMGDYDAISNLAAHWPLDSQDSVAVDVSGNGNHGTLNNVMWAAASTRREIWDDNGPFFFTFDATDVLSVKDVTMPIEFALYQNYPNPFNPKTTIKYDLPNTGQVEIVIYDMMGRQIKQLISGHQDAGRKSVVWDSTNDYGKPVSAGVYLYKIQASNFVQTKKMVLLK